MASCSLIRRSKMAALIVVLVSAAAASGAVAAGGLDTDFYSKTCPHVQEIVRDEMVKILKEAPSLAGPLLRLHFHDCFVRVSIPGYRLYVPLLLFRVQYVFMDIGARLIIR